MSKHTVTVVYRTFFGLLALSAVLTEIVVISQQGSFNPFNFFSYFTIESNIFAAIVLIVATYYASSASSSRALVMVRGAATLYMTITGIVFAVLLSGIEGAVLTAVPWDNIVLHYIMPVVLIVDWFFNSPRYFIGFKDALVWLIYPLLYVVYTIIRGPIVDWYPYPFLDPDTNGIAGVVITMMGILTLAVAIMYVLRMPLRGTLRKHL